MQASNSANNQMIHSLQNYEVNSYCLSSMVCGTLLQQPELTKTHNNHKPLLKTW